MKLQTWQAKLTLTPENADDDRAVVIRCPFAVESITDPQLPGELGRMMAEALAAFAKAEADNGKAAA